MIELGPSIADVVEQQLPETARLPENNKFVALMKHYYEWLMEKGQPTEFIHNLLSYRDIDLTNADFRQHLAASIYHELPACSKADIKLLSKHITEFLKAKGSFDSFQFIMNAIYGEDIEMVWNSDKLFRASANEYSRKASLAIESIKPWTRVEGSEIIQLQPHPASAIIMQCVSTVVNGVHTNWLVLDDKTVVGRFVPEGNVEVMHNDINRSWYREEEYYQPISFNDGLIQFKAKSEKHRVYNNQIIKQIGSNFRAVINQLERRQQKSGYTLVTLSIKDEVGTPISGSFGYIEAESGDLVLLESGVPITGETTNPEKMQIGDVYIFSPALENILYTKAELETGIVSKSIVDVNLLNPGSLYVPGDVVKFRDGTGVGVDGFVAEVSAGSIDSVNIIKKGYGYAVGDQFVSINGINNGSGFEAVVSAIDGIDGSIIPTTELNSFHLSNGGNNYKVNDIIEVAGGVPAIGTPYAKLQVSSVSSAWLFKGVRIISAGFNYPRYTKLALVDTSTTTLVPGFAATFFLYGPGRIVNINVTSIPTITTNTLAIVANGYGAEFTVNLVANAVSSFSLVNAGVNYINPVVVIHGDGTGAVGVPVVSGGTITGITVVKGGSGYTTATVSVHERLGTSFFAAPLIQSQTNATGTITGLTIIERGTYEEVPPCFDVETNTLSGIGSGCILSYDFRLKESIVANAGHYYQSIDTAVSGTGIDAELVPTLIDGVVQSLNKVSGGSGYTYAYVFIAGGTGFIGQASIVGGAVDSISVLQGGFGYSSGNIVTIVGDGINASYNLLNPGNIVDGVINQVAVLNGGSNYYHGTTLSLPTSQPGAIESTLTPIIVDGVIKSVTIGQGSGYIESDLANLTINAGTTPLISATVSGNGGIVGYNTINSGSGYFSQAEITPISLSANIGSGAVMIPALNENGSIISVDVLDGGQGYTLGTVITVSGGDGSGAVLKPIVYNGRITDIVVMSTGVGYNLGTSMIVLGDGMNAAITPIVETGITSAEVVFGGTDYIEGSTVINITDPTGFGAEIRPVIMNNAITALEIVSRGTGYTAPVLTATIGTGADLRAIAARFIKRLNITNKGSGYTYADMYVLGDGSDGDFNPKLEKLGSIDTTTINAVGVGITATPIVTLTDTSGYGSVSRVAIKNNGGGYEQSPVIILPNKYNGIGELIATGAKFSCSGKKIGGIKKVAFNNHGAGYGEAPTPIFTLVATLAENAAFTVGETITARGGLYKEVTTTNLTLLENGSNVLLEDGTPLDLDIDDTFFNSGAIAKVVDFDFDRNLIKLNGDSDIFLIITEDGSEIMTQTGIGIVDQKSSSFGVGDILVGEKSGGHATIQYLNRANGLSIVGGNGWSEFSYANEVGKLNNAASVIADNNRYQDYAYVVKAGIALQSYETLLKKTVHPAGFAMFGDVITQTMTESNVLNEIGYNRLISIIYILSLSVSYQKGSEWNDISALVGDFTKFNFVGIPISLFKDYQIHQTSDVVFKNYNEYLAGPLIVPAIETWLLHDGLQITHDSSIAPDSSMHMHRLYDSSQIARSFLQKDITQIGARTYSIEFFIKKQVNAFTHPKFVVLDTTSAEVDFNTNNGMFKSSGLLESVEVISLADYWYFRMIRTVAANATVVSFHIIPAQGYINTFGLANILATGSIEITEPIIKDITGLTPVNSIMKSVNSYYASTYDNVPDMFFLADTETLITVTP